MNHDPALHADVLASYDRHVRDIGGEVKASEAMEAIRPEFVDRIAAMDRDVDAETDHLIKSVVTPARNSRKKNLKRDLDWILDASFSEDGAYMDPLLDQAFGLGQEGGTDKTLRSWTREDFRSLVTTHYRVAADQTGAAKALDESVQRVLARMDAAGVDEFGELEWN